MKTTIRVSQRHIDRGVGVDPRGCALAIALNEQVPTCEARVIGGCIGAVMDSLLGAESRVVRLPKDAQIFIQAFDIFKRCGHVAPQLKPFKFEIDVPDELVAQEPTRTREARSVGQRNEQSLVDQVIPTPPQILEGIKRHDN